MLLLIPLLLRGVVALDGDFPFLLMMLVMVVSRMLFLLCLVILSRSSAFFVYRLVSSDRCCSWMVFNLFIYLLYNSYFLTETLAIYVLDLLIEFLRISFIDLKESATLS